MKFSTVSLITRLAIVGIAGLVIAACSSTLEGMGKDLQTMGNAMGGSGAKTTQQIHHRLRVKMLLLLL